MRAFLSVLYDFLSRILLPDPISLFFCQEFCHRILVSPLILHRCSRGHIFSILRSWTFFLCVTPLSALPIGSCAFSSSTPGHILTLKSHLEGILVETNAYCLPKGFLILCHHVSCVSQPAPYQKQSLI